jgi:hypothetical protein
MLLHEFPTLSLKLVKRGKDRHPTELNRNSGEKRHESCPLIYKDAAPYGLDLIYSCFEARHTHDQPLTQRPTHHRAIPHADQGNQRVIFITSQNNIKTNILGLPVVSIM